MICSDLTPELRLGGYEVVTAPTHEVIAKTGTAIFRKTDVGSPEDMESLVASAISEFGRLDMYVRSDWAETHFGFTKLMETVANFMKLGQ